MLNSNLISYRIENTKVKLPISVSLEQLYMTSSRRDIITSDAKDTFVLSPFRPPFLFVSPVSGKFAVGVFSLISCC